MRMPGGYKARVAERGQNLSGGQRQRIALARIFLENPPILILDEGTSALDNISEKLIQQAINAARNDRTVILVAHRLTTLLDTDRILVFDDGRIVETGSYDELLRQNGVSRSSCDRPAATCSTKPVIEDEEPAIARKFRESPELLVDFSNPSRDTHFRSLIALASSSTALRSSLISLAMVSRRLARGSV